MKTLNSTTLRSEDGRKLLEQYFLLSESVKDIESLKVNLDLPYETINSIVSYLKMEITLISNKLK